jgi:hypothetical protein
VELGIIQVAASVSSLVIAAGMAHILQTAKAEVLKLRAEIAEGRVLELQARAKERDDMLAWINGSFMRAAVVEARWTELSHRMGALERNAEG